LLEESFIVRSYRLDFISVENRPHPTPTLVPTINLFDNSEGNTTGRKHAVVYFHVTPETFGTPGSLNDVFYVHYDISLLQPTMEMLKAGHEVECYFKTSKSNSWTGIRSAVITR